MPVFQSTHPRGVRQGQIPRRKASNSVSIHAPTRGATPGRSGFRFIADVSIHAPTRGATVSDGCGGAVSIHAPTRGATERRFFVGQCDSGFQSTHPRGVRRVPTSVAGRVRLSFRANPAEGQAQQMVSIHAPTRGATVAESDRQLVARVSIHAPTRGAIGGSIARNAAAMTCFNPRTHAGCDGGSQSDRCAFQSTHPRGVRQQSRAGR